MRARGFTMIEMMIGISLLALLLLLAMPAFIEFTANTKVRNVGEGLINGLRQAQFEAVKRNTSVRFAITADGWEARDADTGDVLKSEVVFEKNAANPPKISTEPDGTNAVTFNGLGRVSDKNADGTEPIAKIKLDPPDKIGTRSLGIAVTAPGGNLKMCDPDAKFTYSGSLDPLACPFPW
jgi:type IV fimbrial biogenesis protein FimT